MAEQEIVEPIVVTEKRELPVPNFNKKEIEEIVRETVKNKISSYPDLDGILDVDGDGHPLTDEIYAFIVKCFEVGKIKSQRHLLNLGYVYLNDDPTLLQDLCFGCGTSVTGQHEESAAHLEIYINHDDKEYTAYITEL